MKESRWRRGSECNGRDAGGDGLNSNVIGMTIISHSVDNIHLIVSSSQSNVDSNSLDWLNGHNGDKLVIMAINLFKRRRCD